MTRHDITTRPAQFRCALALALALAGACAMPAHAQQKADAFDKANPTALTVHSLAGGAYWVEGGRSNTGFVVGDKGVVVIDAQMTLDSARSQIAAIGKVTAKPINTLLLTHGDPDHVGGAPAYPAGIDIIAQENTRSQIVAAAADPTGGPVSVPLYHALLKFLPQRTIGATESVVINGVPMVLIYVAPAHSSGDLVVYLPDQKVVFAGDILTTNLGQYPIIHYDTGGSSLGWIATIKAMLALDANVFVAGHGPVASRADLQTILSDTERRRAQIKQLVLQGKTIDEVKAALPEAPSNLPFLNFIESTFLELSKGYPAAAAPWTNLRKKK